MKMQWARSDSNGVDIQFKNAEKSSDQSWLCWSILQDFRYLKTNLGIFPDFGRENQGNKQKSQRFGACGYSKIHPGVQVHWAGVGRAGKRRFLQTEEGVG